MDAEQIRRGAADDRRRERRPELHVSRRDDALGMLRRQRRRRAGTGPSMYRPGAPRSGFANPSTVYPKADHGAARSSFEDTEPETSFAPTVMMKGSFPGA